MANCRIPGGEPASRMIHGGKVTHCTRSFSLSKSTVRLDGVCVYIDPKDHATSVPSFLLVHTKRAGFVCPPVRAARRCLFYSFLPAATNNNNEKIKNFLPAFGERARPAKTTLLKGKKISRPGFQVKAVGSLKQ